MHTIARKVLSAFFVALIVFGPQANVMARQGTPTPACADYESCLELIDQLEAENATLAKERQLLSDFILGLGYNPTLVINAGMAPERGTTLIGLTPEELVPYSEGNLYSFTQTAVCGNKDAINQMIQEQLATGDHVDQFAIYDAIANLPTYDPILGKVYSFNDAVKAYVLTWQERGVDKTWALNSPDFTLVRAFSIEANRGLYNDDCSVDVLIEKAKTGN